MQDPRGPASGQYRVLRGGYWDDVTGNLRVSLRAYNVPTNRIIYYGFRWGGEVFAP